MNTDNSKKLTEADVRRMLADWYDAALDPVAEAELARWFADTPDSVIPADLQADAVMFRALCASAVDLTADEMQRFSTFVDGLSRPRIRRFSFTRIAAAACVVAIVATALIWGGRDTQPMRQSDTARLAAVTREAAADEPTPEQAAAILNATFSIVDNSVATGMRSIQTADNHVRRVTSDVNNALMNL